MQDSCGGRTAVSTFCVFAAAAYDMLIGGVT